MRRFDSMNVALFVPCYIDQFYPQVAIACVELLEKLGANVTYPTEQTCCGQPLANSGFSSLEHSCAQLFEKNFADADAIVAPSGSCVLHVKTHLRQQLSSKVFELTEFLTDVLKIEKLNAAFPFKVGLHQSCHGQRGLMLAQMSERVATPFSKPEKLLNMVDGLQLISLDRQDECCGFGGTFCIAEEAVSVKMGKDRVADHEVHGADFITASDMSCLMHLEGILKRKRSATKVIHIAEILNASR